MPKVRETKVKNLSELPLFLTINNIVNDMGFSRPTVDAWFKTKGFPVIDEGVDRVGKYEFMEWLRMTYAPNIKSISYFELKQIIELVKNELEVS